MLGPQASQLSCPPVTQSPLHQTPPPASTAAGMPSLQHPAAPGMTPPQPTAPTQPSTPVSSSGQTPTPTPGSVPSANQSQSTPTVQATAQAQVTPQPPTPVQPPSVATPQSSQQQPTPVHAQPPGTPVSLSASHTGTFPGKKLCHDAVTASGCPLARVLCLTRLSFPLFSQKLHLTEFDLGSTSNSSETRQAPGPWRVSVISGRSPGCWCLSLSPLEMFVLAMLWHCCLSAVSPAWTPFLL